MNASVVAFYVGSSRQGLISGMSAFRAGVLPRLRDPRVYLDSCYHAVCHAEANSTLFCAFAAKPGDERARMQNT